MSMRTYGGQITGLVIKSDLIDTFIKNYIESNPDSFRDFDSYPEKYDEMESWLQCNEHFESHDPSAENGFYAAMYSDDPYYDTASIYQLSDVSDWHQDIPMPFIVVEADRSLLTRNVLNGKFYQSKDELISEFRAKVGEYLPDDFDYEGNIGDIEYAVFC